ncbi:MAG: Coenzyme F420 hydrogenase/dehydrogenase, beta subunit C-terminal domain [Bacillota bacterium]|nr:Coenzyme F420 hydrogenase/dehydrogenase, beta subunit C-terminal domain [Bacillota bacterium]
MPDFYLDSKNKSQCYGCGACANICPKDSIKMKQDDEGFLYPSVNKKNCIECGLCRKVCPFKNTFRQDMLTFPEFYAAWALDENILMDSSSGGMFHIISEQFLNRGGVIVGAKFDDDFNVIHDVAETRKERDLFKRSKYVQSEKKDIYKEVRRYLKNGVPVLFTGTPCEVQGLYGFLGGDDENLCTIDFVCSGVPSPLIFDKFKKELENRNASKIKSINFRSKKNGWDKATFEAEFENNSKISLPLKDTSFGRLFSNGLSIRPCCYECNFSTKERKSDITIGDFWGIQNIDESLLNNNRGVSLLIINSGKGIDILSGIKEQLFLRKCSINEAMQPRLHTPPAYYGDRESLFDCIKKFDCSRSADFAISGKCRLVFKIKRKIKYLYNKARAI